MKTFVMSINDLIGKVRVAIDEVKTAGGDEDFDGLLDTEIRQALVMAGRRLMRELPVELLPVTTLTEEDITVHVKNADGTGSIGLRNNFLRFVELRLSSWKSSVWVLTEPGSNEAVMQASEWTRGTPEKPKAMMGAAVSARTEAATVSQQSEQEAQEEGGEGDGGEVAIAERSLRYWTAGKVDGAYVHDVEVLSYVPELDTDDAESLTSLAEAHESSLVYVAAGLLMEGKQHGDLADRFYKAAALGIEH